MQQGVVHKHDRPGSSCTEPKPDAPSRHTQAHPKEQARRRDPRHFYYSPVLCPNAKAVSIHSTRQQAESATRPAA
jgi:hypothetical protein